ncbi:MAG: S41 family peptidase [Verrucomicrobiota bacterium]
MKQRITYGLLTLVLGLNLFVGFHIYQSNAQTAGKEDPYANYALLARVMEIIRQDYVDGDKVSYQELIYGALRGMVATLDPHSEFMEPRKYDDLRKDTEGVFGGVGIVISVKDNYVTVVAPMEDTPGFKAGIMSGDRIIEINGKSTEKLTVNDAVKRLRGAPGSEVTLTILRPTTGLRKEVKITRAVIKVDTVKDINGKREFPLMENNIGYIRLTQFGEQTASDLEKAIDKSEEQGMNGVVLDLRGNPGGLLDQAVKVAEKFLPRGQLVVSTEGRAESQKSSYTATGRDSRTKLPMVVLVNGGSASASEIVAGCLQDVKRAIVIGEQTFGKGSVQSILPLQDGSALRLTTAKYYTPSHKQIHEKGITPDIIVQMSLEDEQNVLLQRSPGGLEALDEKDREKVKNTRDVQLDRAVDLLKGITLYTAPEPAPQPKARKVATKE